MVQSDLVKELQDVRIQQYKTDIGFRTLVEGINENLYVIPKYQRKYRWKKEQLIALVESLICGLPVPPVYTCRNADNQLEILDGQQRIMSLFFYYIGYFMNKRKNTSIDFTELNVADKTFKDALLTQYELEELHVSIPGKDGKDINVDYAELPMEVKRRVDYTSITVIEIKIDSQKNKAATLRKIFANLNRGGTLLSQQEQRNGIYVSKFYDKLQEFNCSDEYWRKVWGRKNAKEDDMELLLRLCAMKKYVRVSGEQIHEYMFKIDEYNSSYVELVDRFSEDSMQFSDEVIKQYIDSLSNFLKLFQIKNKMSSKKALLESFYVVYEKMGINTPITEEIYNDILKSERYKGFTRQGTVNMKSMNERWKCVYEIWAGANGRTG